MRVRLPVIIVTAAIILATTMGAKGCSGSTAQPAPGTNGRPCDQTCSHDKDTITVECHWLPNDGGYATQPIVEITWTKAGAQMHHEEKLLGDGKTYQAWEHDWAQENHPRISITCDGNAPMATQCNIYYTDPDGNYTLIDFERRGSQAPMGSVNCNTDHYVSLHYNKGD